MNCREARKQFGSIRPDSADRDAPEFAGAMSHLSGCSQCRTLFEAGQRIDRRIGRVMRDVPLPSGLRLRLLESLRDADAVPGDSSGELAATYESKSAVDAIPSQRGNTRRGFVAAVIGVGVAAAVLGVMFWPGPPATEPALTLADLRSRATLDLRRLPAFDGNFEAGLPGGAWKQRKQIRFDEHARGDLPQDGHHRVALYGFRVSSEHGRTLRGVLLVIPKQHLGDAPANDQPVFNKNRPENYAHRASGTWHTFAWSEGDVVYVCFIPKGGGALQILQQAISGNPV
ncbi:MAG: twin-arginine translocation signal domain-containing protein [Planctomycetaceae bacterium]